MGNIGCGGGSSESEIRVYGDYFNADTRSILSILMYSGKQPKLVLIDTLQDASDERKKYRR